jgi:hypothetical protein
MDNLYVLWSEQLEKLQAISDRLHGGSDKMRDEGHKLWLVINQIREQQIEAIDAKEIH